MATLSSILPEESHTWCTTVDCCKRLKQLSMWKTQGKSYTNYTKELDKEVKVCWFQRQNKTEQKDSGIRNRDCWSYQTARKQLRIFCCSKPLQLPRWFSGKTSACHYRNKGLTPGLRSSHKLWSNLGPVPQVLSPCSGVRELQLRCSYWSLCALLSVLRSNRSHCNERSTHRYRRAASAPSHQRKAHGATDPAQPKID